MRVAIFTNVVLAFASSVPLDAQELKSIDLRGVSQRVELRHPPAPPPDCVEGKPCMMSGGVVSGAVSDGAPDTRDPRALGVYLENVYSNEINPTQPFEVEFKLLNTGRVPMSIPVSPHLSDLQRNDSEPFEYFSIALDVRVAEVPDGIGVVAGGAFVELYGAADHEGTMLVLKPGEWIRVNANVKFRQWPVERVDARFRGGFWLRKNTFTPRPGGSSRDSQNLYPNHTETPWTTVKLVPSTVQQ
jgi:hypothetical protein